MRLNPNQWYYREDDQISTNEILEFDSGKRQFSRFEASGTPPTPRRECAVDIIADTVFVFGGKDHCARLEDFFLLDMKACQWTRLTNLPNLQYFEDPSFSAISQNELMLMYADIIEGVYFTKVYNTGNSSWTEGPPLPPHNREHSDKGHEAVPVKEGTRVAKILCMGGTRNSEHGCTRCSQRSVKRSFKLVEISIDVWKARIKK